jgi:hypothetical protein
MPAPASLAQSDSKERARDARPMRAQSHPKLADGFAAGPLSHMRFRHTAVSAWLIKRTPPPVPRTGAGNFLAAQSRLGNANAHQRRWQAQRAAECSGFL